MLRILLLAALFGLPGRPLEARALDDLEPASACRSIKGDRVSSLSVAPAGAALETLRFAETGYAVARSWGHVVRGACAASVRVFSAGTAMLDNGQRFSIDQTGAIVRSPEVLPPFPAGVTSGPKLPGAEFVTARSVTLGAARSGAVTPGEYLGLWRRAEGWLLGGYRVRSDGGMSAVKPLLVSRLPLLGLYYLPSPDTMHGQIGLVQQVDEQTVRLIGFDWGHSNWFPS